jgi:hypothetical protein
MDSDGRKEQRAAPCPICGQPLSVRLARGRRSGKPFVMLICEEDGRHFRAFISHRPYVQHVLDCLESGQPQPRGQS